MMYELYNMSNAQTFPVFLWYLLWLKCLRSKVFLISHVRALTDSLETVMCDSDYRSHAGCLLSTILWHRCCDSDVTLTGILMFFLILQSSLIKVHQSMQNILVENELKLQFLTLGFFSILHFHALFASINVILLFRNNYPAFPLSPQKLVSSWVKCEWYLTSTECN